MLIYSWSNFFGANRMLDPRRLQEGVGVNAVDLQPGLARMVGFNAANVVVTTGGVTPLLSAYRFNSSVVSDTGTWVQWTQDVDVVRSLIPTDPTEEIFYTGDGAPKRTDTTLGLPAAPFPASSRPLGVAKPPTAMSGTVATPGGGASESRTYVDTFRNDKSRESAPGTGFTIVCNGGSTVNLTGLAAVPGGYPDITTRLIYVSTDGGPFRLCVTQASGVTTALDAGARGAILQTGGSEDRPAHEVPPSNMTGLIGLFNGMLGGFFDKTYCISEPQKPWAWPVQYQASVRFPIVSSGKWANNWLLTTTGSPVLLSGTSPLGMVENPLDFPHANVSKRSTVSMPGGVAWAGPEGLCFVGEGVGAQVCTEGILLPEQWEAMNPSSIVGGRWGRYYLGFYNDGIPRGFIIDPRNPQGITYLTQGARGTYFDPISGRLYLLAEGNVIRRWNHPSGARLPVTFKTGIFRHPYPTNPGAAMVVADTPTSVLFTLWANVLQADKSLVWTAVLSRAVTTNQPFTLPSGYLASEFQLELVGAASGCLLAEELRDIV
jgi:hypothetical protein